MEKKIILQKEKNDNRETYLIHLFNQFKMATGLQNVDIQNDIYAGNLRHEFSKWLNERENISKGYQGLLNYMDFDYENHMTAEVGKGIQDSIVLKNRCTTIITPYTYGMKEYSKNKIIKGSLKIVDSDIEKEDIFTNEKTSYIDSFMTQNPYHINCIEGWDILHNSSKGGIILGVYGKLDDKDREQKLTILRDFRDLLYNNYKEEYIKFNGEYYYIIGTKRHTKVKAKNR